MFFPSNTDTLGAILGPEAVYRLARNVWRPFAIVVPSAKCWKHNEQHHNAIVLSKYSRTSITQAHPARPPVQLQDSRAHRTTHLSRLEYSIPQAHHHFQHRHDLHNMGYTLTHGQDTTNCARQGSLRCALLCRKR